MLTGTVGANVDAEAGRAGIAGRCCGEENADDVDDIMPTECADSSGCSSSSVSRKSSSSFMAIASVLISCAVDAKLPVATRPPKSSSIIST